MTTGDRLNHCLVRFFALRQHSDDALFNARLDRLRRLQDARLRQTHRDYFADPGLASALEFLVADIYTGRDLLPVAGDIRRALPYALKLLPDKVMATSASALEAAVLTQELDEALTVLLDTKLDSPLDEAGYVAGFRSLGRHDERARQLRLIGDLGAQLERYVRSRLLLKTFKLVKRPAHKAGFGDLYNFMERCFAVMQPVPDARQLLDDIVQRETLIMRRVFSGAAHPFDLSGDPA